MGRDDDPIQDQHKTGWYMHHWQKVDITLPNGKKRTDWVYRGPMYDLPPEAPRLQLRVNVAVCAVVLTALYIFVGLFDTRGGLVSYVSVPLFLGLLPLMYFLMGAFWYVYTTGPMTYRRYHASFLRMRLAGVVGVALAALSFAAEAVFLVMNDPAPLWRELVLLAGLLICAGQYLMVLLLAKRYPVTQTEDES